MVHHKAYVRDKALNIELMTHDTFVFPSEVKDSTEKKVDELQKTPQGSYQCQNVSF
jgi:hypothetical protein